MNTSQLLNADAAQSQVNYLILKPIHQVPYTVTPTLLFPYVGSHLKGHHLSVTSEKGLSEFSDS